MLLSLLLACAPHYVAPVSTTRTTLPSSTVPKIPDLGDLPRVELPSGLVYTVLREGSGTPPQPGQTATLHYNGFLAGGDLFDSSYRRGQPFSYVVSSGMVIAGFDEAIRGMKPGERRVVIIPPNLGYGPTGAGAMIPPNATLVFELELLKAE